MGAPPGHLIVHRPLLVDEVVRCLRPAPGELAVDCTLGGGGHARAILERLLPGGRLIALDVDPIELPRAEARLRAEGFGPDVLSVHAASFADLPAVLAREGRSAADIVFADLGVSAMQHDSAGRGFHYKQVGPLDMRMNPEAGEPASALLTRSTETQIAAMLEEHADEPHAAAIARLLKRQPIETTHLLERVIRTGLAGDLPDLSKREIKASVRRTFQALRIAVNGEFDALDALLRSLPACLAPGGRVAMITFHSGEDRRVKKAFRQGLRDGLYSGIARDVIRTNVAETRANRRALSAKLRWAVRERS